MVAELLSARNGACLSGPFAAYFGPHPKALAEGHAAGRGVCFSVSVAAYFGPGQEVLSEGWQPRTEESMLCKCLWLVMWHD